MSIASELTALAANKAAIKAAIEAKNPSTMPTDALSQWPTSIASIPSGGGETWDGDITKGVTFFDCDGAVLHHWNAPEVAGKTELPTLPTRTGLVCQEWNWTLAEIKSAVADGCFVHVGATYTTDDGKTRIYITIPSANYASITFLFSQTVSEGVSVDWGDGSAPETVSGTGEQSISHAYAPQSYPADYIVKFNVTSGTMAMPGNVNNNIVGHGNYTPGTNNAYAYSNVVKAVEIGASMTAIRQYAFRYCYALERVTMPNTLTEIYGTNGDSFAYTNAINALILPRSIQQFAGGSISYSNCLSVISIPPTIPLPSEMLRNDRSIASVSLAGHTAIPSGMLRDSGNVENVTMSNSVTTIGGNAFSGCRSLRTISLPSSLQSISGSAFASDTSLFEVSIPNGVTTVGTSCFSNCTSLKKVVWPSTAVEVPSNCFQTCESLATIELPEGVTTIGQSSFYGAGLLSIILPSTVTKIMTSAFRNCASLLSITIPSGAVNLYDTMFSGCSSLRSVDFPSNATFNVGSTTNLFNGCWSLVHVLLPSGLTEISPSTFHACSSLPEIEIPPSVTTIGANAFYECSSLSSIALPSGVTSIGQSAFQSCRGMSSMSLGGSLSSIGSNALNGCTSLTSLAFPASLASIAAGAFYGCTNLTVFDFRLATAVPTLANTSAFASGAGANREIVVPDDLYETWIGTNNWNSSTNSIKETIVKASESSLGPLT